MTVRYEPAVVPTTLQLPPLPAKAPPEMQRYMQALHQTLQETHKRVAAALVLLNQFRLYVGALADRPTAADTKILYLSTDDSSLYVDTGSWVQVSGGSSTAATTVEGYTATTLAALLAMDLDTTLVLTDTV